MSNNIDNNQNIPPYIPTYNPDIIRDDRAYKKTASDNHPTISASEDILQKTDEQISFEDLKNTFEGLREGPNLNHELHALLSTIISSAVAETIPKTPMQNTSTDSQNSGSSSSIESAGPANNKGAMRRLQQVLSSDSRFIQQLNDYLQLSSPARKDEHIQNKGLEYRNIPSTLKRYHTKRQEIMDAVKNHIEGNIDITSLKQQLQPVISYIDPAIMVIDNTLKMEEARLEYEQKNKK